MKDVKKWIKRNNFEDNQEYAEKVLKKFEIEKYHFSYSNGEICLLIEKNLRKYKIVLDTKKERMNIFRCEVHANFSKYTKENMVLKKYFEDDCIWDSIKWVAKDSKIST